MKKFTLILFSISISLIATAQSNLYFNNYWQDTYLINPASIDQLAPDWKFGLGSKKQWFSMPGAPVTGQLAVMYCDEHYHLQTGLSIIADKIGYTYTTDIGLLYAYLLYFRDAQLNLGVALHWQNLFYDKSQMIYEENYDPALDLMNNNLWEQGRLNSDFGMEYSINNSVLGTFLFGFAAKNFIPPTVFSNTLDIFPNTNYLYGRYRSNNRNQLRQSAASNFDYSLAAVGVYTYLPKKPDLLQGIFNMNIHWNYEDYIFTAGLLYSTKTEIGIILGLDWVYNFSTSFVYQYNWSVRTDIYNPIGSFELVLTYRVNPKGADKPCKKGALCLPERRIPKSSY